MELPFGMVWSYLLGWFGVTFWDGLELLYIIKVILEKTLNIRYNKITK